MRARMAVERFEIDRVSSLARELTPHLRSARTGEYQVLPALTLKLADAVASALELVYENNDYDGEA